MAGATSLPHPNPPPQAGEGEQDNSLPCLRGRSLADAFPYAARLFEPCLPRRRKAYTPPLAACHRGATTTTPLHNYVPPQDRVTHICTHYSLLSRHTHPLH